MKKTILMLAIALGGSLAHAKLSEDCMRSMQEVADGYLHVQALETKEITEGERSLLLAGWVEGAQLSAITCSGIAELAMERSVAGRAGLISRKHIVKKGQEVYQESINYFNFLISQ